MAVRCLDCFTMKKMHSELCGNCGKFGTPTNQLKESNNYIPFGDAVRAIGMQCQYACRYLGIDGWTDDYPDFGYDVRVFSTLNLNGITNQYHQIMIHKDDVEKFVTRIKEYRISRGRN